MDLWSEPMNSRAMAMLLAGVLVWLILIVREVRAYLHNRARRPTLLREEIHPDDAQAERTMPPLRIVLHAALLLALMAFPFLVLGMVFGPVGPALGLTLLLAAVVWSLWQAAPHILARCGARPVTDANLIEVVEELAAKARIPPPYLLETQENHSNAFALGSNPARAAVIVTLGLRTRLNQAELRAVIGHEIARIANRDTARATIGVTLLSPLAGIATRLGLIGPSVHRQGAGALLFLLLMMPLSAVVLRFSAAPGRAYRADREGAALCGDVEALIAALTKLDASAPRFESITAKDQPALAALCIVDPLPHSWVGHLFAAQPRTTRRIARLRALAAPDTATPALA
jgi:heat shock protein HtpX